MKSFERVEELTQKAIDDWRSFSDDEWLELQDLVARDPEAWIHYRRTLETETMLRGMDGAFDVEEAVMGQLEQKFGRRIHFKLPPQVRTGLALAAAAMVMLGAFWTWRSSDSQPQAELVAVNGNLEVVRGGKVVAFGHGESLQPNDRVSVSEDGTATWSFDDASEIEALAKTQFVFAPSGSDGNGQAERFELIEGTMRAEIAKQPKESPFVIRTMHSKAVVRGTRFQLDSLNDETRLYVERGLVDLVVEGGETVSVGAGETGIATFAGLTKLPARADVPAIALYHFGEGGGQRVMDRSSIDPAFDLVSSDPLIDLDWRNDGLALDGTSFLVSETTAKELVRACQATNEVTFEAWITPEAEVQGGPARIIALSRGSSPLSIMLAQGQYRIQPTKGYVARTPTAGESGTRQDPLSVTRSPARRTHLVFTHASDGTRCLYVDGELVSQDVLPGDFSNWPTEFPLSVGGDVEGKNRGGQPRTWKGIFHLVAVYPSALAEEEVLQNFQAGPPR